MRVREYLKMESSSAHSIPEQEEKSEEPFEGMQLDSEDCAISFYLNYASRTGFRTRFSRYCRSPSDNSIIFRKIICSKSGFHQTHNPNDGDQPKRPRTVTKVGCKAMIELKRSDTGKWVVAKFEKEHNHDLRVSSKKQRVYESQQETRNEAAQSQRAVLYEQLYKEAVKFAEEGSVTEDIYEIAIGALREASMKVSAAKKGIEEKAESSSTDGYSTETCSLDASPMASAQVPAATLGGAEKQKVVGGAMEAMPVSCAGRAGEQKEESRVHAAGPGAEQKEESRVHATAVACGARVIPADQAVSLVHFIQAKIRSGQAIVARSAPLRPPRVTTLLGSSSDETGDD